MGTVLTSLPKQDAVKSAGRFALARHSADSNVPEIGACFRGSSVLDADGVNMRATRGH